MSAPALRIVGGDDAQAFTELLARDTVLTFQTFADNKERALKAQVLHGQYRDHASKLRAANDKGAGVFVMVNAGDGKGRTKANVKGVRALFVDLDGSPLEPVTEAALKPHITVETSSDRFHAYWLVDGVGLGEFTPLQRTLADRFNGDPSVSDLPRVMRVPGFFHKKETPFLTRLLTVNDAKHYQRGEFLEAMGIHPAALGETQRKPRRIPEGSRNDELMRLAGSFRTQGLDHEAVLRRIRRVNAERCEPPLDDSEVKGIVENVFRYSLDTFIQIPHDLFDSDVYAGLTFKARALALEAVRREAASNGPVSLIAGDLVNRGFGHPKTLQRAIGELLEAGFLQKVRNWRGGPSRGARECALYRTKVYGTKCHKN